MINRSPPLSADVSQAGGSALVVYLCAAAVDEKDRKSTIAGLNDRSVGRTKSRIAKKCILEERRTKPTAIEAPVKMGRRDKVAIKGTMKGGRRKRLPARKPAIFWGQNIGP